MTRQRRLLRCLGAALLSAACQASPMPAQPTAGGPPPQVTAAVTGKPIASSAEGDAITPGANKASFRGPDECQTGPEFELTYDPGVWGVQETGLVHRTLAGCSLLLAAHGRQVAGPKIEERKELAGFAWQVSRFPSEGLSSYWLETSGGCYLFEATYGSQAPVEAAGQCQEAADIVIDSFRLIEPQAN